MLDGIALDVLSGHPRWKDTSARGFALAAIERELLGGTRLATRATLRSDP